MIMYIAIPDHGGGIFPWLITCAAFYTIQGAPTSGVGPSWKKAFSLMITMRCLQISLIYGETKTKNISEGWFLKT